MKQLLRLSSLLALLVFIPGPTFAQCSGERWSVKIGTDADAGLVNLNAKTSTTISALSALTAPSSLPDNNRVQSTETTVWVLNATLIKYVRSDDFDYHLVFSDGAGHTMIAEIPDPGCVSPNSPFAAGIAHARAQFDAMFTASTNLQSTNVAAQITGVGFFDYFEGQEGIAPNAIELHPVIDIVFGPTFQLRSAPSLTIAQGGVGSTTITSTLVGNFNSSISLSASGLPAGATANFSPTGFPAPGSGSSTMTISVGPATPAGTYNVIVSGSGGGQTQSVTINLTVSASTAQQLLANTGFENGAANPAPWTVTSGVIDNSSFEAPHTGSWKAWLDGYGSAHTDSILQQVSIPSTATSTTLSFWRHIDTAETANVANDTMKVQVRNASGGVLATLATYSNLNAAAGYTQQSFDLSSYKGQTIQIYLVGIENSSLKTSFVVDDFTLNASGSTAADFGISSTPTALTVKAGTSGTATIKTTISGSFNSGVSLSTSGLPTGATANFNPTTIGAPSSGQSTLTIAAGAGTPVGSYTIVVNGSGGGKTHSATISLTVSAASGGTQQLLGNPGFENGLANPSPWTVSSGVIDNSSFQAAHGGSWKAWLNGYGSVHTDSLLQQVTIPSNATGATLSFWRHIDTAETTSTTAYDTLKVQIRNSSGTVLATLATYSNLNAATGYAQATFNLSAYKGQTIQIYLVGTEDSSLKTSFVVDDFLLNVTTP